MRERLDSATEYAQATVPAFESAEQEHGDILGDTRPPGEPSGDDRLLRALRVLWVCRALVFKSAIAAAVLIGIVSFLIPNRYTSTTRLMPPENQSRDGLALLTTLAANAGGAAFGAADLLGFKSSGALFVGILRSRTVEDRLIERHKLKQVYGSTTMQNARQTLEARTDISEDRKSGIITLTVFDHDRQRAVDLARAYVAELDRLVAELTTSSARRERMFLEERLRQVQQDLDVAEKQFSEFASKNSTLDIKEQGKAMVEAAAVLQGQLIAAQSELRGVEQVYTDNNVRVRSVRARIAELQRQLKKMGGEETQAGSSASGDSDMIYPSIRKLPLLGVSYADLYRRVRIQETVYEVLTRQYELAKVQEAKEIPTVRVLDPANWPERKAFPPRLLIIISGTTIVFGLVVVGVLLDNTWRQVDAADPRRQFAGEVTAWTAGLFHRVSAKSFPGKPLLASAYSRARHRNGSSDIKPEPE